MAKKQTEGQLDLIENDTPEIKAAKKTIKGYDKLKTENTENHAADRKREKEARQKVLVAV